jgi:PAS domain S-box-containing protein
MLETLFQHAPDGVLLVHRDGAILRANRAACELFGRTDEGFQRVTCAQLVQERGAVAGLLATSAGERTLRRALTCLRDDGSTFPAELTATVIASSTEPQLFLFIRDLSAAQRAEAALASATERFRAYFEGGHPAYLLRRVDGTDGPVGDWEFLATNAAMLRVAGAPITIGSRLSTFAATPERFAELSRVYEGVLTTGEPAHYYVRRLEREFATSVFRLPENLLAVVAQDRTEERRVKAALDDALARFDAFMDASPASKWMKDDAGRYVYVNATWESVFGLDRAQVIGRTDADIANADVARARRARDAEVLATGVPVIAIEQMVGAVDGEPGWWRSVHFLFVDGDGHRHTGGIATDVTVERRSEEALRASEARARAAQADLERALELARTTEEKFRQSQKMEAIGRLAGGIAHDFNNLLTVILSSCEYLADQMPESAHLETVAEVARAGERAAELTQQLLAFSRRQVLEPRVLSLNSCVTSAQRMLHRLLGEDIDLVVRCAADLHLTRVDPSQVEQVILNLAVNARDAMVDGGRLTIETGNVILDEEYVRQHPDARVGEHVMLSVSDTGTGMTEDVQGRLFEPFFTTKPLGKGTGLGLATVYGIVTQSGGTIYVYSELQRGSVFKVYFPRAHAPEDAIPVPVRPVAPLKATETVLLVEDDPQVRRALQGLLKRTGYTVLEASNGGEALLLCEQEKRTIHLMLTDIVMPKMNGRVLADRLRAMRPDMRVVFMSGYTEDVVVHHGVLDAGVDFLQKPITSDALLPKLREVLARA